MQGRADTDMAGPNESPPPVLPLFAVRGPPMQKTIRIHLLPLRMVLAILSLILFSCSEDTNTSRTEPTGTAGNASLVRTTLYGRLKGKEAANHTYAWLASRMQPPP